MAQCCQRNQQPTAVVATHVVRLLAARSRPATPLSSPSGQRIVEGEASELNECVMLDGWCSVTIVGGLDGLDGLGGWVVQVGYEFQIELLATRDQADACRASPCQ